MHKVITHEGSKVSFSIRRSKISKCRKVTSNRMSFPQPHPCSLSISEFLSPAIIVQCISNEWMWIKGAYAPTKSSPAEIGYTSESFERIEEEGHVATALTLARMLWMMGQRYLQTGKIMAAAIVDVIRGRGDTLRKILSLVSSANTDVLGHGLILCWRHGWSNNATSQGTYNK